MELKCLLNTPRLSSVFIRVFCSIITLSRSSQSKHEARQCILKSVTLSILAGVICALIAVAALAKFDERRQERALASLQQVLNDVSLPLFRDADTSLLLRSTSEQAELSLINMRFIEILRPLVGLDAWTGQIIPPSIFELRTPSAQVTTQANYASGSINAHAQLFYSDGQWQIQRYEVTRGTPNQ